MIVKRIELIVASLCLGAYTFAQDKMDTFGDDKKTFILLPAESISGALASNARFSPTGRYITYSKFDISYYETAVTNSLIEPRPPMMLPKWFRYDRINKVSKLIPLPEGTEQTVILGDERTIFFCSEAKPNMQGFIDIPTGKVTNTSFDLSNLIYMGNQPDAPYLMLGQGDRGVLLVKPNGQSLTFQMPPKVHIFRPLRSDSSSMTFLASQKGEPSKVGHLIYNSGDGSTSFKEMTQDAWQKDVGFEEFPSLFWCEKIGDLAYVKLINLPKSLVTDLPTKARLGLDNCNPTFGPKNDCVVYEDAGALLIREIKPMDPNLARKLQALTAKAKAMMGARQAASGLTVYAADNDGVLPGAEGWENKVSPYFKNTDFLRDFNYTFKGGNISSIDNPATTELGFTMGPGGRAVAYADGHVKWVPNP